MRLLKTGTKQQQIQLNKLHFTPGKTVYKVHNMHELYNVYPQKRQINEVDAYKDALAHLFVRVCLK